VHHGHFVQRFADGYFSGAGVVVFGQEMDGVIDRDAQSHHGNERRGCVQWNAKGAHDPEVQDDGNDVGDQAQGRVLSTTSVVRDSREFGLPMDDLYEAEPWPQRPLFQGADDVL